MNQLLIFFYTLLTFVPVAFWEAYAEGKYGGAKRQCGWKKNVFGFKLTAYHFWLWHVSVPLFLSIPLVVSGFSWKLFFTLYSAYFFGGMLEDFLWFVVNPYWSIKKFNSKYVDWHWWVRIAGKDVPMQYVLSSILGSIFLALSFYV